MASGVKYEDLEPAVTWAFGSINLPIRDWVETWNHKHKDLFEIKGSDSLFDITHRIGRAWVDEKRKEMLLARTKQSLENTQKGMKFAENRIAELTQEKADREPVSEERNSLEVEGIKNGCNSLRAACGLPTGDDRRPHIMLTEAHVETV